MSESVNVFISYAREDAVYKDEFLKHTAMLRRSDLIKTWNDKDIVAGSFWGEEIKGAINNADIVVFLVTSDLVDSDFIHREEIEKALIRQKRKEAYIVPVLVRPVSNFDLNPLGKFQSLPNPLKAITLWKNSDQAWVNVVENLTKIVKIISDKKKVSTVSTAKEQLPDKKNQRSDIIPTIKKHVVEGKIKHAIILLLETTEGKDEDLHSQVILLSSRYNNLKREERLGIISNSDANIQNNRIVNSVLEILKNL